MSKRLRKIERKRKNIFHAPKAILWLGTPSNPDSAELRGYVEFTDMRLKELVDKHTEKGFFCNTIDFAICSGGHPAFYDRCIYLWGTDIDNRVMIMTRRFLNRENLLAYSYTCIEALNELSRKVKFTGKKSRHQQDLVPPDLTRPGMRGFDWARYVFK